MSIHGVLFIDKDDKVHSVKLRKKIENSDRSLYEIEVLERVTYDKQEWRPLGLGLGKTELDAFNNHKNRLRPYPDKRTLKKEASSS